MVAICHHDNRRLFGRHGNASTSRFRSGSRASTKRSSNEHQCRHLSIGGGRSETETTGWQATPIAFRVGTAEPPAGVGVGG